MEEEHGFNLNTDKYNWEEHRDHFILQDAEGDVDFGECKKNIYALPETEILIQKEQEVQMAVKKFGTVYREDGSSFRLHLETNEIKWYQI